MPGFASTSMPGRLSPALAPFGEESPRIHIGNRLLTSRYFLAPLAGYTHLAFRVAVRELGGLGLATTDLVHAGHLLSQKPKSLELIATNAADRPLSVQIFSGKIDVLVQAARWLEAKGYGGVDLNMGCPMAKINGQGGGARLMCDVDGASRLVAAVVSAISIPVTVKMRLGWDADSISAPLLAREFEKVGVAAVTVHGRTRQQGFQGDVQFDAIRRTVDAVENIPVVGNGDVRTVADAIHMRRYTGCAAVAIGRGAMLDPWIFHRIDRVVRDDMEPFQPTADEQVRFLVRHFQLMTEQHGQYGCVLFRKFAGWYGARLGIPEDLEDRLRRIESVDEFDELAIQIRERHGQRETSIATALVKVPNGPIERW
ncbi:MAG: tRNA-dihydrouridine synthase [Planctomycetaceae bacterium]